jgi:hypothetical protein
MLKSNTVTIDLPVGDPWEEVIIKIPKPSQKQMDRIMAAWCTRNRRNKKVLAWLKQCPPPKGWKGTRLQWAWCEAPLWIQWNGILNQILARVV